MSTDLARPEISVDNSLEIYPEFLRKLLLNRGITNLEEAQNFLEPDYENHLHDLGKLMFEMMAGIEAPYLGYVP